MAEGDRAYEQEFKVFFGNDFLVQKHPPSGLASSAVSDFSCDIEFPQKKKYRGDFVYGKRRRIVVAEWDRQTK